LEKKSLEDLTVVELRKQAEHLGIEKTSRLKKIELIEAIEEKLESSADQADLQNHQHAHYHEIKEKERLTDDKEIPEKTPTEKNIHEKQPGQTNQRITNGSNGNGARSPYYKIKDSMDNVVVVEGNLEILPEGFGFVKNKEMKSNEEFVYISGSQIQKFKLETGDVLSGKVRPPKTG